MRAVLAWVLVGLSAAWVAMRLLGLERGYPLVPLAAFTPFAAAAAVGVVIVVALLRQRAAALAATALAIVLVAVVAPRAVGGPHEGDGERLRVLSANMHFGHGSAAALVEAVRRTRPDVLSVQELTPELAASLDAAGLRELLPERVVVARGSGIGLYAREPLAPRTVPGRRRKPLIAASIGDVEVIAVHTPAPLRPALMPAWRGDLRALPGATPDGTVRVLAGDFNSTLDHAELRRVLDTGYADAAAEIGSGLTGTWPAGRRFPPPVAIDHVLVDERVGVRAFSTHRIPGTDHKAVFAELVLP